MSHNEQRRLIEKLVGDVARLSEENHRLRRIINPAYREQIGRLYKPEQDDIARIATAR